MSFRKRFKVILITLGISSIFLNTACYSPNQKYSSTDAQIAESIVENADTSVLTQTAEPIIKGTSETKETAAPTPTPTPTYASASTQVSVLSSESPQVPAASSDENNTLSCTLSIRCDTILDNIDKVSPEKAELIPKNGVILPETKLEFLEGETVFDVLKNELRKRQIHFEFTMNSMYDSAYVEGIGHLYEFDAGDLSGWIYFVNRKSASLGCSQYELKNGDKIEFLYTCNMGRDL